MRRRPKKKTRDGMLFFILIFFILSGTVRSQLPLKVIKDPKPNLIEKKYTLLEKVGEIIDEVAKDEFLFLPFSAAMDREGSLFIYDMLQAKVLKFDSSLKFVKSFGGEGGGPGEFRGKGRSYAVFLNVTRDGKLLAHDIVARKVSVFDTFGTFIKHIPNTELRGPSFLKPFLDNDGYLVHQYFKDGRVVVYNDKGKTLLSITHKEKKKEILFIEEQVSKGAEEIYKRMPFFYNGDELRIRITGDGRLLLYFEMSATLHVVNLKDKKRAKTFRIWPEKAIRFKRPVVEKMVVGYSPLFSNLFLDGDHNDIFYLDFGLNEDGSRHYIYKMNLDGGLIEVLYIPQKKGSHPHFLVKQNNLFFAKMGEKITIYKEKQK